MMMSNDIMISNLHSSMNSDEEGDIWGEGTKWESFNSSKSNNSKNIGSSYNDERDGINGGNKISGDSGNVPGIDNHNDTDYGKYDQTNEGSNDSESSN